MFKNLSGKYYQENKDYKKKACGRYQDLFKEEKEKSHHMAVNLTKSSQEMKK